MCRSRTVKGPQDARLEPLLQGPWISSRIVGTQSVVVPAAALAAGNYTISFVASLPETTVSLKVEFSIHLHDMCMLSYCTDLPMVMSDLISDASVGL